MSTTFKQLVLWLGTTLAMIVIFTITFGFLNWLTADGGESFRSACVGPYIASLYTHGFCLTWVYLMAIVEGDKALQKD